MSLFGALPFVINGDIPNYIDALFETVSGFTTTGATILTDVEKISKSIPLEDSVKIKYRSVMGVEIPILNIEEHRYLMPSILFE